MNSTQLNYHYLSHALKRQWSVCFNKLKITLFSFYSISKTYLNETLYVKNEWLLLLRILRITLYSLRVSFTHISQLDIGLVVSTYINNSCRNSSKFLWLNIRVQTVKCQSWCQFTSSQTFQLSIKNMTTFKVC